MTSRNSVSLKEKFGEAVRLHQGGQLDKADAIYREILAVDPDHASALNLLGVVSLQRHDYEAARRFLERAVHLEPDQVEFQVHLGEVYRVRGEHEDALGRYQAAIRLQPDHPTAYWSMGISLVELGRHGEAAEAFARAVEINPENSDYRFRYGVALARAGRDQEAADILADLLDRKPDHVEAAFNLGVVRENLNDDEGAVAAYQIAVRHRPEYYQPAANLAVALQRLGKMDEAGHYFRHTLQLKPDEARLVSNYANYLQECGDIDSAESACRRAIELDNDFAGAYVNLGAALVAKGHVYEAIRNFRAAVERAPEDGDAHANLGLALMLLGQFEEGCRENRWRWRAKRFMTPLRPFSQPLWRGQDLAGKTLLLWGEQGAGDEIMMMSQADKLVARAERLIVECDRRLVPLFKRSFPDLTIFPRDTFKAPDPALLAERIDYQVPMVDTVSLLARRPDDLAGRTPYLTADRDKVTAIRARYASLLGKKPKVGIAWFSINKNRRQRIADLDYWKPILTNDKICLVDLQYGNRQDEREAAARKFDIDIFHDDTIDSWASLDDFAAQVAALDMVISISNTTVHVAGALGVPCWTVLPTMPDWRWFLDREDTPWYANMRLFRQRRRDDWAEVLARVGRALEAELNADSFA